MVREVTGLVLAGGLSRRFDGEDKGWQLYRGKPLVEHALAALSGQERVVISANRHVERYRALGYPVLRDRREGYQGPLSGLETAFLETGAEALLVVPCDVIGVPEGWAEQLVRRATALESPWVGTLGGDRLQPLLGYWSRSLLPLISQALDQDSLRVMRLIAPWQANALRLPEGVELLNLNTPDALAGAESRRNGTPAPDRADGPGPES